MFQTKPAVIRHMGELNHANSLDLVDQSICRDVGIYTCSHSTCPSFPKIFFKTEGELNRHNADFHPQLPIPTHRSMSSPIPPHLTYRPTLPDDASIDSTPPTHPLHPPTPMFLLMLLHHPRGQSPPLQHPPTISAPFISPQPLPAPLLITGTLGLPSSTRSTNMTPPTSAPHGGPS